MTAQTKIKLKMRQAGITQNEAANRLEVTRQTICQRLNGQTQSLLSTLEIADCIGLKYRITERDGTAEVPGGPQLLKAAKEAAINADAFEKLLDALGWKLEFDWE